MNQLNDILDQDLDPTETREWTESLQKVIDADFAELVDDEAGPGQSRVAYQAIEQSGLASSQKSGDDGDGNEGFGPPRTVDFRQNWVSFC